MQKRSNWRSWCEEISLGWLAAAIAYYITVTLSHLQVSLWLVKQRSGPNGNFALKDFTPELALASAGLVVAWIVLKTWKTPRAWLTLGLWVLLGLCIGCVDRWLTFSVPEYAHYPQFALLAWLLARALDSKRTKLIPGRILFWTTLLGAADELTQYLWITTSYSEYLDFNDILVNMLGGAAGVLIYYGFERPTRHIRARLPILETATACVLAAAITIGLQSGRLILQPDVEIPAGGFMRDKGEPHTLRLYLQRTVPPRYASYNKSPYRGQYWILDPISGIALTLLGGTLFGVLVRQTASTSAARPCR